MATGSANSVHQMERLTTCPVCLDKFRIPKVLPCMHTFCLTPCLTNLVDPRARSLRCPECRREHQIPAGQNKISDLAITRQVYFNIIRRCPGVSFELNNDRFPRFTTGSY